MSISNDVILNTYLPFNIPIPCNSWNVHPIKLKDWNDVQEIILMLQIDKNIMGNIEYIQMSNLDFFLMVFGAEENLMIRFERLLRLVLNIQDDESFAIDDKHRIIVGIIDDINGDKIKLSSNTKRYITDNDFDKIRRAILYQNILEYDDRDINPDVKRAYEEYIRLKNKNGKVVPLEHKILCVQLKTGMSKEAIGDLTVRNFLQLFDLIVAESEYNTLMLARMNGAKVDSFEHWALKERKDKYAEAFCDANQFKDKIQNA